MSDSNCYWAVVPAAGVGKRMAADRPKQYLRLGQKTVIEHTLDRLIESMVFKRVIVALSLDDPYWPTLSYASSAGVIRVPGGKERADSVLSALDFLLTIAGENDWVLVHDAARPCLQVKDIHGLIDSVKHDSMGGILALPLHDTLKNVSDEHISDTVDRTTIWRALTPQMFRLKSLRDALKTALVQGLVVTDEASAIELQGGRPRIVEACPDNIKITRPEDLPLAGFYLEQQNCE